MSRAVAIAGVALSDVGRVDDKNPFELMAQASRRALADAGLSPSDVDGLGSTGQGTLPPVDVGEYLGLRPRWVDSTSVGGAAWEVMASHAADAIAVGHADVVLLTYGSTARADLRKGLRGANINWGARGPLQWEAPYGHTLISKYAMAARRHMHQYGTTIEQLAEVAVSARFNAADNPEAYYRDPITIDDVLSGPMIADPFTKLHCCIRSDGGAAVVLVAADRAKDLRSRPVWVLGSAETTSHMLTSQWDDMTVGPAAVSGPLAFQRAGVKPVDVDVAEIYDAFTYMLLCTLEDLGFCEKGEGGAFVEQGALRLGGELPTNTDGGGLSACHPGQRGLFLLVEAVRQLRGECGPRQVPDAKIACVSATGGWFCSSGTMILGSEEP
ncbi:thiolase, C-terminal domain protein [Mycolicibacterium hassiacum DSM 44199]|uniref:Thiolase, C-terminal domain protein n=1 Tax=Mycolicibacterium hassiacum (strain DSM 44199 / CIP 105218 / JCM 12690 / 3849) TaxID=1122247 RepID=K5BCB8_MYCHD|nr:acetyl-CoA acetyltransferase [Mycolicibacterium hassiacum]EKF21397.1 thiolase, C-terminal domain protein [Mycolicibacterium hassiacum DSM 44199]MBX5485105.1 acetyl-CoA acetyltransferase [Mycolicibacterium hassiacum]MDA4087146.1 thiolase [Mycolicibacterium hassiacum DSM 44199]VCT91419.1 3-ketoacyl-CoA thiolase [Mycolicibacterium hassiacum DSM 44199]